MASLNFDLRLLYPRTTSDLLPQVRCTVLATGRRRTIPVIVKITDLNDNAPVFRGTPYTLTLPEDTPVGTTVFRYRVIPRQCRVDEATLTDHHHILIPILFLTFLTVASNLWRPAPWYGWVLEAGDDVDILLLAHRHYSLMSNCFFETLVIQVTLLNTG